MSALLSAVLSFLLQASLLAWTARLYQSPGWTDSVGLLFADRLVYALVMPVLGALLLFLILPRLTDAPRAAIPRPAWFRRGSSPWMGLFWAMVGALVFFGLILVLSELLPSDGRSGGLAGEIRRSQRLWLFLITTGLLTPLLEELYYRGILQEFLQRNWKEGGSTRLPVVPVLVQGLCFGLVHGGNGLVPAITLFTAGLGLGILYWRYGLVSSILAHSFYNLAILLRFQG